MTAANVANETAFLHKYCNESTHAAIVEIQIILTMATEQEPPNCMRTTKEQREVCLQCAKDPDNSAVIEGKKTSALSGPFTGGKVERKADGFQRMVAVVDSAFPAINWTS